MSKNKRALYVGFNKLYMNPYLEGVLDVFSNIFEISYVGPGFALDTKKLLNEEFLNQFYFVITDSFVFENEAFLKRKNPFGNTAKYFEQDEFTLLSGYLRDWFLQSKLEKILIANWDYYNLPEKYITEIIEKNIYVLGTDRTFISDYNVKYSSYNGNNIWNEFSNKHKKRIISSHHFISVNEFTETPLKGRKFELDVPGTGYKERKDAQNEFNLKWNLEYWKNKIVKGVFSYLMRSPSTLTLRMFNLLFSMRMAETKVCFTSGSDINYPVRKFFEIPAKSSLLICIPFTGFSHLGFIDGVNCITVISAKEVRVKLSKYSDNEIQQIAINGYNLIKKSHSMYARRDQWVMAFDAIINKSFEGSYWKDGEYIIDKNN